MFIELIHEGASPTLPVIKIWAQLSSCLPLSSANPTLLLLQVFAQGILPTVMAPLSLILPSRLSVQSWNKSESRSVTSNSLEPHGLQPSRLPCPWNSPGRNSGVDKLFPSLGDLPNPGIKLRSPALRQILHSLSHQGSSVLPPLKIILDGSGSCLLWFSWPPVVSATFMLTKPRLLCVVHWPWSPRGTFTSSPISATFALQEICAWVVSMAVSPSMMSFIQALTCLTPSSFQGSIISPTYMSVFIHLMSWMCWDNGRYNNCFQNAWSSDKEGKTPKLK